jgi:hypothetical protein
MEAESEEPPKEEHKVEAVKEKKIITTKNALKDLVEEADTADELKDTYNNVAQAEAASRPPSAGFLQVESQVELASQAQA